MALAVAASEAGSSTWNSWSSTSFSTLRPPMDWQIRSVPKWSLALTHSWRGQLPGLPGVPPE